MPRTMSSLEPQDALPSAAEYYHKIGAGPAGYDLHFKMAALTLGAVSDALDDKQASISKLRLMIELANAHTTLALAALEQQRGQQRPDHGGGRRLAGDLDPRRSGGQ